MDDPKKQDVPAGEEKTKPAEPQKFSNQGNAPRKARAGIVWLLILLGLGSMLLFKSYGNDAPVELTQSAFEKKLAAGEIASANLTSDGDRIFAVEGKLKPLLQGSVQTQGNATPKTLRYRSRVVYSESLNKALLTNTTVKVENDNSGIWNFLFVTMLPVILIIGVIYFVSMRQMRINGKGALDFGRSKARMIPPDELHVKFSDIAGADEAKEEISEIVEFLKDPLRFQLVGGRIPKGCLLVGEPGTGKTLMAKAVACEAGVPFFSISGSDFVEMFVGVGASRVRDMFEQARKCTPCLIFIDEIDAVGRSRFSGWGGGHDEREQTLNAMLVEMDGLESRTGVIVLAATNRPDVLDPALLRPGRFDRQVVMDLPDIHGRRQILDVHVKKIKVDETINLDIIARTTPGFSGADLANLCNEAALLAARRNLAAVSEEILEEARDKVSYGSERRSRKINDRERRLTAYHEAGHTLVALFTPHCVPVHKVTIIPRGQAALGATFMMPKEDTYTKSKLELEADMAMAMGGRAAEELVLGDVTTGASADIQHLSSIARRMVCLFGMDDGIGPVKLGEYPAHPHVRIDGPPPESMAPETAREIDLAVRKLVQQARKTALDCLQAHRDELEKLAQALLEKETLSVAEIRTLLGLEPEADDAPAQAKKEEPVSAETAQTEDTPDASAEA